MKNYQKEDMIQPITPESLKSTAGWQNRKIEQIIFKINGGIQHMGYGHSYYPCDIDGDVPENIMDIVIEKYNAVGWEVSCNKDLYEGKYPYWALKLTPKAKI